MKQTLDQTQIKTLFSFVKSKHVPYIDVQYELVDHLATGIEELMEENPNITFDSALKNVYSSQFPVTGFNQFITSKIASYSKLIFKEFFKYFTTSKFLITVLAFSFFYFSLLYIPYSKNIIASIMVFFTIIPFGRGIYCEYFSKNSTYKNRYLIIATIKGFSPFVFNIILLQILFYPIDLNNTLQLLFYAGTFAYFLIVFHLYFFVFPKIIKKEISTKYGHLQES